MRKDISSEAKDLLSSLDRDSIVDPDAWHFHIKAGGKSIHCTPQLTRDLVRNTLVEINEYKPNFLSHELKKDFNLVRIADNDDLIPSENELKRLKDKLQRLTEEGQVKFYIQSLKEDPNFKIQNTIVSAWIIDIQDVNDFINGVDIEIIYRRVAERRKELDKNPLKVIHSKD